MTLQIDSVGKNSLAYGRVNNGTAKVGDILLLNNEMKVEINTIYKGLEERVAVTMGDSVVFSLQEDIKLTRGDMLCDIKSPCNKTNRIDADICWFDATRDMNFDIVYLLRHTTKIVEARIEKCHYRLNTINLSREEGKIISANEIGHVTILMNDFIYTDPYIENRNTGSFIIIDPLTNNTVAVGMIR
jgi:bifunctional enzyme CysN/CysC